MAYFTTRVELHHATSEDYDALHAAMEAGGFSRTIKGGNGTTYHLPTAEYSFQHGTLTVGEVRDKALAIAKTVKSSPAVLVTEGKRSWTGLKAV